MYIILHQFFYNCTERQKVFHLSFFRNHYSLCVSEIQCSVNIFVFCGASPHFLALACPIHFLHPIFHAGANLWHPSKQHSPKKIYIILSKFDTALVRELLMSIAKHFKYSILFYWYEEVCKWNMNWNINFIFVSAST
jgi:hypothetical protein